VNEPAIALDAGSRMARHVAVGTCATPAPACVPHPCARP